MHLVIVHYHLAPGGVTTVITHQVRALLRAHGDSLRITLLTGRPESTDEVRRAILAGGDSPDAAERVVQVKVDPLFGYTDEDRAADVASIEAALSRASEDDALLWVHNYHLGKNPALTAAVSRLSQRSDSPRILLHIHDFPECGRYANLARVTRFLGDELPLYPTGPRVRYAVINRRDREVLAAAGIAAESVHEFPNPSDAPTTDARELTGAAGPSGVAGPIAARGHDPREAWQRLFDRFGDRFPAAHRDGSVWLYPVRTIRRKNVFEAALLARMASVPANLVVTLPGTSEPERPYSDLVEELFRRGTIPGMWGTGVIAGSAASLDQVVEAADLIVSASVQEGFGFQFADSVRWGKPLLARNLDILRGFDELLEGYPHHLYDGLEVPLRFPSLTSPAAYLRFRYREHFDSVADALPPHLIDSLRGALEDRIATGALDFSFLPVQMQATVLSDLAADRELRFIDEIRGHNAALCEQIDRLHSAAASPEPARIERFFGYDTFSRAFHAALESFDRAAPIQAAPDRAIRQAILERFATLDYFRLLYQQFEHGS